MQTSLRYDLSEDAYVIDIEESRATDVPNVVAAGRAGITGRSAVELEERVQDWIDSEALDDVVTASSVQRVSFEYDACRVIVDSEDGRVLFEPTDESDPN